MNLFHVNQIDISARGYLMRMYDECDDCSNNVVLLLFSIHGVSTSAGF